MTARSAAAVWESYHAALVRAGRRPRTLSSYRRRVWDFFAYLDGRGRRWDRATPADLERWLARRPLAANTAAGYDTAVRGLYRHAARAGLTSRDRMAAAVPVRGGQPQPRALGLAEVAAVLAEAGHDTRLQAMLWLAFGSGLRACEVAAVRIEDTRLTGPHPQLTVCGKGGKTRTVPLAAPVRTVLAAHLAGRPGAGPVIESLRVPGGHLRPQCVSELLARVMHDAGVAETGHALRHSFATLLLEAGRGANVLAVSRLLGHSSSATTERIYTIAADLRAAETIALLPDPRHLGAVP